MASSARGGAGSTPGAGVPSTAAAADGGSGVAVTAADREELVADTLILQEKLHELSQQLEGLRGANAGVAAEVALLREAKAKLAATAAAAAAATTAAAGGGGGGGGAGAARRGR